MPPENKKREPVKATAYQIERWAQIAHQDLDGKFQAFQERMRQRHELEKSKSKLTDVRHAAEKLLLSSRDKNERKRLDAAIQRAKKTGIIPDPEFAPTHTQKQISEWGKWEFQKFMDRCDKIKKQGKMDDETSIQLQIIEHEINNKIDHAYDTGRIPDHDYCRENGLPVPDKERGHER